MATSELLDELRNAGLRLTAARRAVVEVLEGRREHLSADDVYGALRERGVSIDLSSVYRTLDLLSDLGLVRQVTPAERHAHFEIDHQEDVHLTCSECGRVTEARLPKPARVGEALTALARRHGFQVSRFGVEAEGLCDGCRARQRARKASSRHGKASTRPR